MLVPRQVQDFNRREAILLAVFATAASSATVGVMEAASETQPLPAKATEATDALPQSEPFQLAI